MIDDAGADGGGRGSYNVDCGILAVKDDSDDDKFDGSIVVVGGGDDDDYDDDDDSFTSIFLQNSSDLLV